MKKYLLYLIFLCFLLLAACSSAPAAQVADTEEVTNSSPSASASSVTETAPESQGLTATETTPQNVIQLGELELVPFVPPWFDGELGKTVFVEDGFLRIDSPEENIEPGTNEVYGAVTVLSYDSFDISATFNAQGGICRGVENRCGNIHVSNCIVFDFTDFDNMQEFCIDASALFWTLVAYENGSVVFHSSAHPSNAIHDNGDIYRLMENGEWGHPTPNELRVTLRDGLLALAINGEEVFAREDPTTLVGYDAAGAPVYRTDGWMSGPIHGQVGAGCVNSSLDPFWTLANCEINLAVFP